MAREIESALRELLGSVVSEETWAELQAMPKQPGQRDPDRNLVIDAICSALGFDDGDEVRLLWKTAGGWHKAAHRGALFAPNPTEDALVKRWDQLGSVLRVVLRAYEGAYTQALPLISELASADPVTKDDVSRLLNGVPNSGPSLIYFFDRATPAWFPKLRDKGYFRSPPRLQPNEDGFVAYQQWPPGRYLIRVVHEPSLVQDVVDVVRTLDTDNPEAAETVADIALAVPTDIGRPLAVRIAHLLQSPAQWGLPSKAVELLPILTADGLCEEAAAILAALLPSPSRRSAGGYISPSAVRQLFPSMGIPGVAAISKRLTERATDEHDDLVYSRHWWPIIDGDRVLSARDELVSMLRHAATSVAVHAGAAEVVSILEASAGGIFRRLALHALLIAPEPTLITARLVDAEAFFDRDSWVEYGELLRAHFADLGAAERTSILSLVDQGPPNADEPLAAERWRLRQLTRFGDALPEQYHAERDALVEKHGAPDITNHVIEFIARSDARLAGSDTLTDLDTLTDDDLITYLTEWVPTGKWEAPDVNDLRRQVQAAARQNPQRFADLAPRFADLDPSYARGLLEGLRQAVQAVPSESNDAAPAIAWPPVLAFGSAVITRPRLLPGRPETGDGDRDPGWIWARQSLAELLTAALPKDLPAALLDQAFELIEHLLDDPDPAADQEDQGGDVDESPATAAINSVRGNAFRALLQYAIRRHDPAVRTLDPRVSHLLDRHLDPVIDPSPAIRSLYGMNLNLLAQLDQTWTRQNIPRIFQHTTTPGIASAAWHAYLRFSGLSELTAPLLTLLYEQHAAVIIESPHEDATSSGPRDDQPEDRLIQHLALLYRHGVIPLEVGPLADLLRRASAGLRARLIELIGIQLHGQDRLDPHEAERLKALWTAKLDTVRHTGGDVSELAGFGQWFSSGALSDDWALSQLNRALTAGAVLIPCDDIAQRLASLQNQPEYEIITALAGLIDAPDEPWFVSGSREPITTILRRSLQSAEPRTRRLAQQTVSRLAARGYNIFNDLK